MRGQQGSEGVGERYETVAAEGRLRVARKAMELK